MFSGQGAIVRPRGPTNFGMHRSFYGKGLSGF